MKRIENKLDLLLAKHHQTLALLGKILTGVNAMAALDDKITQLATDVAALKAVDDSAVALLNGLSKQLADAIAAAQNAGATPAQLQALTDLATAIETNDDALASAVLANTPAQPTP